jgi:hypothetical protein
VYEPDGRTQRNPGEKSGSTVSHTGDDVEGSKAAGSAGMNTAVSECRPFGSAVMRRAMLRVTGTGVPSAVAPSMNWTDPAASLGTTLAEKPTGLPSKIPFRNVVSVVVVAFVSMGALTAKATVFDVDKSDQRG